MWSIVVVLAVTSCSVKKPAFECAEFGDCGPGGACEPNTSSCSFPDDSCTASGRRFSELSMPEYAGRCVALNAPAGKAELCVADAACSGGRKCIGGRCASVSALHSYNQLTCAQCAQTDLPNDPPWCWGSSRFFATLPFAPFILDLCTGMCTECETCTTCPQRCLGSLGADRFAVGLDYVCYTAPELFCGGSNDSGQLGGGANGDPGAGVIRRNEDKFFDLIAAGPKHTCGRIPQFGAVECFGDNTNKQITDDNVPWSPPVAFTPFGGTSQVLIRFLGLNARATCAASATDVACRGTPRWGAGTIEQLPTTGMISSLAVGPEHACVVKDGRLLCWGGNDDGQAAPQLPDLDVAPTEVLPDVRFTQVVAGRAHTCAITTLGAVMCWGDSSLGQLGPGAEGHGPVVVRTAPTAIGPFVAGADVTCALHADDRVRCWGQISAARIPGTQDDIVLDDFEVCEDYRNDATARTVTGTNL